MFKRLFFLIAGFLVVVFNPAYPLENETINDSFKDVPAAEMMTAMDKYDVIFYHIDLDVINTSTYLSGSTTVNLVSNENDLEVILIQLSTKLTVSSIFADNQQVIFTHKNDFIRISLPDPLMKGELTSLLINYSGLPGKGEGIKSSKDRKWDKTVLWTISESSNAYKWFPVKQNLTDKADSVYIYLTVPDDLKAISNGKLEKVTDAGNNKLRYEWITRYPIAYYLISIVVGDYIEYDLTDTIGGKEILMPNYIYNNPDCLPFYKETIDYTPVLVELFSFIFVPYPFAEEKYGQVMAPFAGGMEHQTITMLGSYSFGLMAHELAHQWFGNYVTCATWQDIWINEGFASYSEYLVYELVARPEISKAWIDNARKLAMRKQNGSIFPSPSDALNDSRLFSYPLSYMKGAIIIHMLRKEIDNDDLFFLVLREFLNEYKNSSATGKDFINVLNRISLADYTWFFNQWYYGKGFPKVSCKYWQENGNLLLKLNQKTTNRKTPFFRMNIDVRVFTGSEYSDTTLIWTSNDQVFKLSYNQSITSIELDPSGELLISEKGCTIDNSLSEKKIAGKVDANNN